jgi:DNA-binding NarL/FixJ family response regulator
MQLTGASRTSSLVRIPDNGPVAPSVLIVDDHTEFRRRMRQLLEVEGYEVLGEAADGAAGLEAERELNPDVVLLDVHLPDGLSFDLVPSLTGADDGPQVILISTHDEEAYRAKAHRCGANGFITKDELSGDSIARLLH